MKKSIFLTIILLGISFCASYAQSYADIKESLKAIQQEVNNGDSDLIVEYVIDTKGKALQKSPNINSSDSEKKYILFVNSNYIDAFVQSGVVKSKNSIAKSRIGLVEIVSFEKENNEGYVYKNSSNKFTLAPTILEMCLFDLQLTSQGISEELQAGISAKDEETLSIYFLKKYGDDAHDAYKSKSLYDGMPEEVKGAIEAGF